MSIKMPAAIIYHITTRKLWDATMQDGSYTVPTLAVEGFIHCSERVQVQRSLNKYYAGYRQVLLLHVDTALLQSPLKYEPAAGMMFPHVYGPINSGAVVGIEILERGEDGRYVFA